MINFFPGFAFGPLGGAAAVIGVIKGLAHGDAQMEAEHNRAIEKVFKE